jgi:PAS domain S-box-containing protein
MNHDEKEISCYTTHLLLNYARKKNLQHILDNIDVAPNILDNPREWTYAEVWTTMAQNIENELGGTNDIMTNVIQEILLQETNIFFPLLLRLVPFSMLVNSVAKFTHNYSHKNLSVVIQSIEKNQWSYTVKQIKPVHFSSQMCDFNKGAAIAFLKLKGFKDIKVNEVTCMARNNASECKYIVDGTPPKSLTAKAKNILFFMLRDRNAIVQHIEENQKTLQTQYQEILSIRDFYSHIMKNMNEAILWLDPEGIITFTNTAFCSLTGRTVSEITGNRFEQFLNDDSLSATFKLLCNDAMQKPLTPFETEFSFSTPHGEKRIGHTTILWIPGEHYHPGHLISIRDITEKRIIERQLSVAENRYRSLYENSPAIIVAIGLDGKFLYANPAMTEQSGYAEDELKNMHIKDLIAPKADYETDSLINNLLTYPTRLQEVHFKTKNGAWKCLAINTYHIKDDDGTFAGIAGIGIDITETKRLNEQIIKTQRMDLLGQLAGGLAHDFGNILTSINGFGRLISLKSTDEKISKYAGSIERAGQRAYDLVKSLLAFSRNDEAQFVIFNASDIVTEAGDMIISAISPLISVKTELPDIPLKIHGDPGKVHQCILNLCMNARDAIGDKHGVITLRLQKSNDSKNTTQIQVEDTGSGIPPDIIDKIFDPFFSTKAKKSGTGLGLSVVYGIMKSHGGDIIVDSRPGEGTIFTLGFPPLPSLPA